MNTTNLGKALHSISHRKLAKPFAICITALFVISMITILAPGAVHADTAISPLHTSGSQILDQNNQVVNVRSIGMAGFAPDMYFWAPTGSDSWADQWGAATTAQMDQTFSVMQSTWHANMIRVFYLPEWYWQDTVSPPSETPGATPSTVSTRAYFQTILTEAAKYGIYVDFVPYQLTANSATFTSDPYMTSDVAGAQGLPLCGWDSAGNAFIQSTGMTEANFWTAFYTQMANDLKGYPNAVFEAWNEPGDSGSTNSVDSGFLQYQTIMYNAIRATGATNLIMMQWMDGWYPNGFGMNLSWASQIVNALGGQPTNLVFTTHFYWYAPSDLTRYWSNPQNFEGATSVQNAIQLAQASMGVSYPLVINEQGSSSAVSANPSTDQAWYKTVLAAEVNLGIGLSGYFWLSDSGLGYAWTGETLMSTGTNYTPNTMGQEFINAYVPPTAAPSPSPSPTPTATPTPAPTATPSPTPTATPTATPAPDSSTSTTSSGSSSNNSSGDTATTPTNSAPTTTTTSPTAPAPTAPQTTLSTPSPITQPLYIPAPEPMHSHHTLAHRWYAISWSRFNTWFFP